MNPDDNGTGTPVPDPTQPAAPVSDPGANPAGGTTWPTGGSDNGGATKETPAAETPAVDPNAGQPADPNAQTPGGWQQPPAPVVGEQSGTDQNGGGTPTV